MAIEEEYNREDEAMRKERQTRLDNERAELNLELKLLRETLELEGLEEQASHPESEAKQIIEAKRRKDTEKILSTNRETKEIRNQSH